MGRACPDAQGISTTCLHVLLYVFLLCLHKIVSSAVSRVLKFCAIYFTPLSSLNSFPLFLSPSLCLFTCTRSQRSDVHICLRAPVDGSSSPPTDAEDLTQCVVRGLTTLVAAARVSSPGDWALPVRTHMQQGVGISSALRHPSAPSHSFETVTSV